MPLPPPSVLGPLAVYAAWIVFILVVGILFLGTQRNAGAFITASGAVLLVFMSAGWIQANYTLAGTLMILGLLVLVANHARD